MRRLDDEGWPHADDVAHAARTAAVEKHTLFQTSADNAAGYVGRLLIGLERIAIADDLDSLEEAASPNIRNVWMIAEGVEQPLL